MTALSAAMPVDHESLRRSEVAWLAMAVFVLSAGYGALLPVLPGWLVLTLPAATPVENTMRNVWSSGPVCCYYM